jgi:hypothetical protein
LIFGSCVYVTVWEIIVLWNAPVTSRILVVRSPTDDRLTELYLWRSRTLRRMIERRDTESQCESSLVRIDPTVFETLSPTSTPGQPRIVRWLDTWAGRL